VAALGAGADTGARAGALDLHSGIVDPGSRCGRWDERRWLVNARTGEAVRGRCRATNLCVYCARLFAVETSEMLLLDAMEDAPAIYVVLTARNHLTRADCRRHLEQLRRSLRGRWPDVRWAVLVEFQRRGALHLNLLVKGVPAAAADELREHAARVWCSRPGVDAKPGAQFAGTVYEGGGLVRYISLHFLKEAQAPAIGWRGHRVSYSRDYLVRPASVMRQEARRSLRIKRRIWKGEDAETAELEVDLASDDGWRLVTLQPRYEGPSGAGYSDPAWAELVASAYEPDPIERLAARAAAALADDFWRSPA
jgi:hypothetical protein